ncbi:MAG: translation initiation factor IF-2 [Puniceicoccales bacterium]|jgi:translation initiation factor IF-2|nr:translation initiation factor IF-2 [Puniceicoccales bacterium]
MSVRVYQLAKELGLENKEVIERLRQKGLSVSSPSSTIPNLYAEEFIRDYNPTPGLVAEEGKSEPKPPSPKPAEPTVSPIVRVRSAEEVWEEKEKAQQEKRARVTLPESTPPVPRTLSAPLIRPLPHPLSPLPKPAKEEPEVLSTEIRQIVIKPPIVVREFAFLLNVKPFRLISDLMQMGVFASINQAIEENLAQAIAKKHGVELVLKHRTSSAPKPVEIVSEEEKKRAEEKQLRPRPPVVCILGHVDHGKTTLLDYLRKTNVAAGEAGGITQHIGAYQIVHNDQKITFLDTPGHAAFSKMRQRGAHVTDIAVLVVAADDGFMPQTEEALGFAQRENVPVVVAINKIDAKGANIDRVKQQMQKKGIAPEDWGGETLCTSISALNGTGVAELLNLILLQAEMMELKANADCLAEGTVIESQMEVGRGSTATVIVERGTLRVGHYLACGPHHCKVRTMTNANGETLKEAPPSTPVKVAGWSSSPEAGRTFQTFKNEKEAKNQAEAVERGGEGASTDPKKVDNIKDLLAAIESSKQKVLKVFIKADVYGSAEALAECLTNIKSEKVALEVVGKEVGPINPNDVQMAHASDAVLVGFNVRLENGVVSLAKHRGVRILQHNIIYELIDRVKDVMGDQLEPEWVENKLGSAEIRQVFSLTKATVAGCMVVAGRMVRDKTVRIRRQQEIVHEGHIQMLKRFKEDVTEVKSGYECGVQISGNPKYEIGDVIECFETIAKKPTL